MLNAVHVHLALNHVPVLGAGIAAMIALVAFIKKSPILWRAAMIAAMVSALAAWPVFFSGEPAEEIAESLPGVLESLIEHHEEAAEFSLAAIEVLAGAFLLAWWKSKNFTALTKTWAGVLLLLSFFAGSSMFRVAALGGQIRHSEIRSDSSASDFISQSEEESD